MKIAVFDTKPYDREYLLAQSEGAGLDWQFYDFRLSKETAYAANGCDAVCIFVNDRCDESVILALQQAGVRLIALRCAGFNNVDLHAAKQQGIQVVRVHAYSPHAVAEHTIALLLAVNRKIHRAYNRVREQNFSLAGLVGFDIVGKRVGIVGTGKIGRATAEIFRGFGATVVACDEYPLREWGMERGVEYTDLETVLKTSDIVSLHVPLTEQTAHMINDTTLAKMKRGVVILNTSRGKLIDTAALIRALKGGQVGAVALDVYEEEEGVFFEDLSGQILLDDELARLMTFPNVLLTAHQAFLTVEALSEISRITITNLQAFRAGTPFLAETCLVG